MKTRYNFPFSIIVLLSVAGFVVADFGGGSGTYEDPYQIHGPEHLFTTIMLTGQKEPLYLKLMADVDLQEYECPQLFQEHGFKGIFDGNGKTISNLYMVDQPGLIESLLPDSFIKNLTLLNPIVTVNQSKMKACVLAANIHHGATVYNCHIKGAQIVGLQQVDQNDNDDSSEEMTYRVKHGTWRRDQYSGNDVGGIACSNSGTIKDCSFSGSLVGYSAAGIAIENQQNGSITGCDAAVDISVGYCAGAIAEKNFGMITKCSSEGTLTVEKASADAKNAVDAVGGLVGRNYGYFLYRDPSGYDERMGMISDCYSFCNVSTTGKGAGGLVGLSWGGIISDCFATGSVKGYGYVGGFIGSMMTYPVYRIKGVIENCFSTGNVSADNKVGGFAGENGSSTITNCYAMGSVNGRDKVGGFVGCTYKYTFDRSLNQVGDAIVENCFSVGKVTGASRTGGLVGSHWKGTQIINNSFWNIETSNIFMSAGGTGKTTNEMIAGSTYLNAGWDFVGEDSLGLNALWWIDEGKDYPRLLWEVNIPPVADTGEDQTAYAGTNGLAQVTLTGTESYDMDKDQLEYLWYNDANDLIATGAQVDVLFEVGEHIIKLYVNDGLQVSEPNLCTVTILE